MSVWKERVSGYDKASHAWVGSDLVWACNLALNHVRDAVARERSCDAVATEGALLTQATKNRMY